MGSHEQSARRRRLIKLLRLLYRLKDLLEIAKTKGVTENSRSVPVYAGLRRSAPVDKKIFFLDRRRPAIFSSPEN